MIQNFVFTLLYVLYIHWVADFIYQSDWMAKNKSTNIKALLAHVGTYGLCFFVAGVFYHQILYLSGVNVPALNILLFVISNTILHFITDYFTSKETNRLWKEQKVKKFFEMIGLDQLIHSFCLIGTQYLMWII